MSRPILLFDGDCGFCRWWVERWRYLTGDTVEYAASQEAGPRFPEIPPEAFQSAAYFVDADGAILRGAEAVFGALAKAPGFGAPLWAYRRVPGFAAVSDAAYALVASHRPLFSRLTRLLWGSDPEPQRMRLTAWLFTRGIGVIYLIAFLSLWNQVDGLIGSKGVLPVADFLSVVAQRLGPERYRLLPTLCWLDPSDGFLHFLCAAGTAASLLLILDVFPALMLLASWAFYLSLSVAGQDFLSFQWDILLLETGFLTLFLVGFQILPARFREPPRAGVWMLRWTLFKLYFMSGCVKLLSGDPSWRHLTAMEYHYETQPLPTWIAWYAQQLPDWFQRISCAGVFCVELGTPFLIFFPRRARFFGAAAMASLQVLILLTGNYCFFNLLTLLLCLLLLDDGVVEALLPKALLARLPRAAPRRFSRWKAAALALPLVFVVGAGLALFGEMFEGGRSAPRLILKTQEYLMPFRTISNYGLFAVMTTVRHEIVIQGSDDAKNWRDYEFKWKPGDVYEKPKFIEPYQPRLDWQMWFAALGDVRENPWFINLVIRLLQGDKPVLALLADDPFPDHAPRYVRAQLYDYRFTGFKTRRRTGAWWTREEAGSYCPIVTLRPK